MCHSDSMHELMRTSLNLYVDCATSEEKIKREYLAAQAVLNFEAGNALRPLYGRAVTFDAMNRKCPFCEEEMMSNLEDHFHCKPLCQKAAADLYEGEVEVTRLSAEFEAQKTNGIIALNFLLAGIPMAGRFATKQDFSEKNPKCPICNAPLPRKYAVVTNKEDGTITTYDSSLGVSDYSDHLEKSLSCLLSLGKLYDLKLVEDE